MRSAAAIALGLALAAGPCPGAHAISTLEDVLEIAPRIFRTPSGMPPNNAVHRAPAARTLHGGTNGGLGVADNGPGLADIPAAAAPWMVAIGDSANLERDFLCAGVLIDPNWALTAAHCLFLVARRWPNDSRPLVFVGSQALSEPGRSFPVLEIVHHPEYSPRTLRDDVALVRFDPGDFPVIPLALQGPPIRRHVGDVGTILGFGARSEDEGRPRRGHLKLIQAAIVHDDVCFSRTSHKALRNSGVYCARALVQNQDICHRFNGSPMVLYDPDGRLYVVGLVTWNTVCPLPEGRLNVFQDVQAKVPWIRNVVSGALKRSRDP